MKRFRSIIVLSGMAVSGGNVQAQTVAVPHEFEAGQAAVASEINENFQSLANAISGAKYDYRDFHNYDDETGGLACSSKVFSYSNNTNDCDTMTRTYTKSGDTLTVDIDVTSSVDGSKCVSDTLKYIDDGTIFAYTGDGADKVVNMPIVEQHNAMEVGKSWGGGSTVDFVILGQAETSTRIDTHTLLAVEDITVNGTDYNECLKIHSNRSGDFQDVAWYCGNVGLVNLIRTGRVGADFTPTAIGTRSFWQLQSCNQ